MSDFRCNFITDEFGKIQSRLANNFYWMLKGHPETEGVFVRQNDSVWLAECPRWERIEGWVPRPMVKTDITAARIFLERQGLRPSAKETADTIDLIAK